MAIGVVPHKPISPFSRIPIRLSGFSDSQSIRRSFIKANGRRTLYRLPKTHSTALPRAIHTTQTHPFITSVTLTHGHTQRLHEPQRVATPHVGFWPGSPPLLRVNAKPYRTEPPCRPCAGRAGRGETARHRQQHNHAQCTPVLCLSIDRAGCTVASRPSCTTAPPHRTPLLVK